MATKPKKKSPSAAAPKPPEAAYVRDVDLLKHNATTRAERRAVLASALANDWAPDDIHTIERIDKDGFHGWAMWRM